MGPMENGIVLAPLLQRSTTVLKPDPARVLLRLFEPGDGRRLRGIIKRIIALPEAEVTVLLAQVSAGFAQRHRHLEQRFQDRFEQLREVIPPGLTISKQRQLLIGSYFLMEYSLESAALFSPSMVPHPDQANLPAGALRFVLSLRATGEGHVSSLTFRSGIVHHDLRVEIDPVRNLLAEPLALSNYEALFDPEQDLSERVIFPFTPSQKNGIEDARFVHFRNDDGSHAYYATYTAYDGSVIKPELLETTDFLRFQFISLKGPEVENKGMALFPRKVNGVYAMISRQDNESIFLMYSDNLHFWKERRLLLSPKFPWELVQIGNCGSPIETDAGWLVLSHGVGFVRQYCIGAFLLDLEDPSKVIGRLREPLMMPQASEREGYVPNVVYSCGALLHREHLIIPYGVADHATGFATVAVADVLAAMSSL
jgi:predicted GH43/DUF377 family glycosyl hydrolase